MAIPKSWEVEIRISGESILTIGSWGLSGIDNISDHADLVRHCADHLHAFIGPEETDNKPLNSDPHPDGRDSGG